MNGLVQEIQLLKNVLSSRTEERDNLQQNIEQLEIKEQTMQKNLELVRDKIEMNKK